MNKTLSTIVLSSGVGPFSSGRVQVQNHRRSARTKKRQGQLELSSSYRSASEIRPQSEGTVSPR